MSSDTGFAGRVRTACASSVPLPGNGETPLRHAMLCALGEEDLSLAKVAEAHFDALAILSEAGERPAAGAVYAVWASEVPGQEVCLLIDAGSKKVTGTKPFCSGGALVDRALVTIGSPEPLLVEIDLRKAQQQVAFDLTQWQTEAFRPTQTGAVQFTGAPVERVIGGPGFYLTRPGFWNGACGPAACWAGGAAGLLHFARQSRRDDPHTAAHRAAMESNVWAMRALLAETGREIDAEPHNTIAAQIRALRLRHLAEQLASDTLHRFARAYGPHPLAMDAAMSRRSAELGIFLRQCHGERDLESLARTLPRHVTTVPLSANVKTKA